MYYTASKLFWNQGEINLSHTQFTVPAVGTLSNFKQLVALVTHLSMHRYTQNTMQHLFCLFFFFLVGLLAHPSHNTVYDRQIVRFPLHVHLPQEKSLKALGIFFCCYWIKLQACVSLCWSMTIHSLTLNIITDEQLNCK